MTVLQAGLIRLAYRPPAMQIRYLSPADWDSLAALIHTSLSTWYRDHLNVERFGPDPSPLRVFPELYEALDPGCCLVADMDGQLAGSVFYHPRETHWAVGIVNSHPDFAGRGIARKLMEEVIARACAESKPVRLVSSAMNLDSFSLYTRLGFVPQVTFQDMKLTVPTAGMPPLTGPGLLTRSATMADVPRIADFEYRLNGIRREKDYAHFVANAQGCWHLWIAENLGGELTGFLGAVTHPGSRMIGPGVCRDEATAIGLLHTVLDTVFRGTPALWLAPVSCAALVSTAYKWGARNVEMHLTSVLGEAPLMQGVTFPTFMPESG